MLSIHKITRKRLTTHMDANPCDRLFTGMNDEPSALEKMLLAKEINAYHCRNYTAHWNPQD
jgi:hypothetical protein